LIQISSYYGFISILIAALAFLAIRVAADYVSSSRHYVIDYENGSETSSGTGVSPNELMKVVEKAQNASNGRRATKGLPVLFDNLNLYQENYRGVTKDKIDYGLNQLSDSGKVIRYKNLIASAKGGEEAIVAHYIYELAVREGSYVVDKNYRKMLKENKIIPFQGMAQWEKETRSAYDSDISIVTLGTGQTNSLRKKVYSYGENGGYLLFLLSNGMLKCVNA
jgi:hypothetical protein